MLTATLRIELLKELPSGTGLFLCRVRAILENGEDPIVALGAGISPVPEIAQAKAVSEAIERLTLSTPARSMANATPISISGTLTSPVVKVIESVRPLRAEEGWTASACHIDLESAVRAASNEAVERRHLWLWGTKCELGGALTVHRLLPADLERSGVKEFLSSFPLEIFVSWTAEELAPQAVVVIAIRASEGCFYAASAAASAFEEAVQVALLDIVKVLIIEEQFKHRAEALSFRRPLSELPERLTLGATRFDFRRPVPSNRQLQEGAGMISAPWLITLKRRIVEIPLLLEGPPPKLLEWFR